MPTELTAVLIEAVDVQEQARFWARALEWEQAGTTVRPPDPGRVGLAFVPASGPKTGKNRLHLDLAGGEDLPGQLSRLLDLGAVPADIGQGEVPWQVLADPEGNEFCLLPTPDTGGRLAAICQDAADAAVQGAFWAAATGWSVTEAGDWGVRLRPASGTGPALVMGPPVARGTGLDRLRFELAPAPTPDGRSDPAAETARLIAAGAAPAANGLLTDPEGNPFHLV